MKKNLTDSKIQGYVFFIIYRFISLFFLSICVFISCQTVRITPAGKTIVYLEPPDYEDSFPPDYEDLNRPDYEEIQHFFLFGIMREAFINVKTICKNRPVKQMQIHKTFMDGLLGVATLGIYTPRTASVWCEEESLLGTEEEM